MGENLEETFQQDLIEHPLTNWPKTACSSGGAHGVRPQPETKDFAYGETWKSVRFSSTPGRGACCFQ